ncbi:MurR/RpiR family transcriptional regulator [Roseovarius sp. M141]|uniref:MurR/RpiR family transcriptional regulator n=1 Tax=Roseovarius sp. M141 TaxID=2583806 RepID=UPI0020CE3BC9|nr:MurR/RpiR family transcriptional regulator [Roseovarius sp. M141]MCQ0093575.1 MurR/RpiR family transcriptional regulator [Roseovarius sp. M141]
MTVQDDVRANLTRLTAGQIKLANALLADYPFAGLQPIQQLADATGVSPPSISRFVSRLGFAGFGDFQNALIGELREGSRSPRDLHALAGDGRGACFLHSYTQRAADLVRQLPQTITQQQLDSVAALLGDPARNIYVRGGRISDTLARFLSVHLRQIRPGIHHLADDPELWPDTALQMRRRDVAVLFDFRRYQPSLERLAAAISQQRRAQVVLITDKWQSPAARHSSHVIALPIEIGTAWDTGAAALALIEALVVTVSEQNWHSTEQRIKDWDALRARLEGKSTPKNEDSR